jgi:two-component system sensor histidine kinase KdpD
MWIWRIGSEADVKQAAFPLDARGREAQFVPMSGEQDRLPVSAAERLSPAMLVRVYIEVLAMVGASTLVGLLVAPRWGTPPVNLLYLPPVLAAAVLYGLRPGLVAAIASALAYNFFFTAPVHTFRIDRPADLVTVAILFLVALVTSQLAARMRMQARIAAAAAARNATIAGLARRLLSCSTAAEIGGVACTEIASLFGCNALLVVPGDEGPEIVARAPPVGAALTPSDVTAAALVLESGEPAGRGAPRLDPAEWLFHPIRSEIQVLAAMGLARDDGRPAAAEERLPLLANLLDQVALALERAALEAEMRGVAELRERDRLRGALLSSVGHDLRTPLTAIRAAAAELRRTPTDPALLTTLEGEAGTLERYISNLLDMARIDAGAIGLRREPVDLVDAVGAALRDLRRSLASHAMSVDLPDDLPLVRADSRLLHHILINLLDNAARHGGAAAAIRIGGCSGDGGVTLSIEDDGPGLGARPGALFETFERISGSDRTGGAGLGLAIVKRFADAMGVGVAAENKSARGGAVFTLSFPDVLPVAEMAGKDAETA